MRQYSNESFEYWRCGTCGTLHCSDIVAPKDLYTNYELHREVLDGEVVNECRWRFTRMSRFGFRRGDRVLDYGCGSGAFVDFLRRLQVCEVDGYDPYSPRPEFRQAITGTYDFIIANDVLEHVEDGKALFSSMASILSDRGRIMICTPNGLALNLKNAHSERHYFHAPFHFHIYSIQAIDKIADAVGRYS